jgi:hypothetical protein
MRHPKKERPCCIACGKKIALQKIEMEHGSFHICLNKPECFKKIIFKVDNALPILWASPDDMGEREVMTEKELEGVTAEDWSAAAMDMAEVLWRDDYFSTTFRACLEAGARTLERLKIQKADPKELPLLMGTIKDKDNMTYLLNRMKGTQ